jgi:hypothetical protein
MFCFYDNKRYHASCSRGLAVHRVAGDLKDLAVETSNAFEVGLGLGPVIAGGHGAGDLFRGDQGYRSKDQKKTGDDHDDLKYNIFNVETYICNV